MLSFFPLDVLDEIWNLIESVSEGFLTYSCTTIHRYPIFSTRYSVMCKVYTGYCGTSEIEHGLCACTVDNPLAKARGLSPYRRTNHALSITCMLHNSVSVPCNFIRYMF